MFWDPLRYTVIRESIRGGPAAAAAAGPSRHTRQHYVIPSSLTAHEGRRDVLPNILSHHKYAHTYCSRVISRVTAA